VLRVPGFLNRKYSPAHPVAVEYPADAIYGPADFRLENIEVSSVLPLCGNARIKPVGKHSHSEEDWAWVCARLAHDMDATKLTQELASRRSDKSDPLNEPSMSPRPAFGWTKASLSTTSSPDLKSAAASRFPLHSVRLVHGRLRPPHNA